MSSSDSWGDWSKRLSDSTRAFSSDLLSRVDEIKSTVGDTTAAAPDQAARREADALRTALREAEAELRAARAREEEVRRYGRDKVAEMRLEVDKWRAAAQAAEEGRGGEVLRVKGELERVRGGDGHEVERMRREIEQMRVEREKSEAELGAEVARLKSQVDAAAAATASAAENNNDDGSSTQRQQPGNDVQSLQPTDADADLLAELQHLRRQAQSMQQEENRATEELNHLRQQVATLREEQSSSDHLRAEVARLTAQLDSTGQPHAEAAAREDQHAPADGEATDALRAQLQALEEKNATLAALVDEKERKVGELQRQSEAPEAKPQPALAEVLARVTKEKNAVGEKLQTAEADLAAAKEELTKSQQTQLATRKRLVSAEEGANRAEKVAVDLQKSVADLTAKLKDAQAQVKSRDAKMDDMSQTLKSFQEELERSHKRQRDSDVKGSGVEAELRAQVRKAQEEERAAHDAFRAVEVRNVAITEELDRSMKGFAEKAEQVNELQASLDEERAHRKRLQNSSLAIQQEYAAYKERAQQASTQREERTAALQADIAQLQESLKEIEVLRSSLIEANDRAAKAETELRTVRDDLQKARDAEKERLRHDGDMTAQLNEQTARLQEKLAAAEAEATTARQEATERVQAAARYKASADEALGRMSSVEAQVVQAREDAESQTSGLRAKIESLQRELRRSTRSEDASGPDPMVSSPVASTRINGNRHSPGRVGAEAEIRLRSEQLEKEVWRLRRENARLASAIKEMEDRSDTVGSLMSL